MTRHLCYAVLRKEVKPMPDEPSKEYLLLFNTITDAIGELECIKRKLMGAQQEAENIYMERTE